MPRPCLTCQTPAAEVELLAGEPFAKVSKAFGISDNALRDHMANHVNARDGAPSSSAADLDAWRQYAGELYEALAPWPDARQAAADHMRQWAAKGRAK